MLRTLIKHEFRQTSASMLMLMAGVLIISASSRLCMMLSEYFVFFEVLSALLTLVDIIGFFAVYMVICIFIILRFYANIYGAEGYITLTLPVERWKHIFTKLIVSMVWLIVGVVITFVSSVILATQAITIYGDMLYIINKIVDQLNTPAALIIAELVLTGIILLAQSVLVIFASISIGQLSRKHRVLGSVVGYIIIYGVNRLIMSVYLIFFGNTVKTLVGRIILSELKLSDFESMQLQIVMVSYIVIQALIVLGCYLVTNFILKKAVNLQ